MPLILSPIEEKLLRFVYQKGTATLADIKSTNKLSPSATRQFLARLMDKELLERKDGSYKLTKSAVAIMTKQN